MQTVHGELFIVTIHVNNLFSPATLLVIRDLFCAQMHPYVQQSL